MYTFFMLHCPLVLLLVLLLLDVIDWHRRTSVPILCLFVLWFQISYVKLSNYIHKYTKQS